MAAHFRNQRRRQTTFQIEPFHIQRVVTCG
ncbi:Uncharacterised protein [Vibrio cholerae]|nr:Uncharacterised protein [Vibrio cholerae]